MNEPSYGRHSVNLTERENEVLSLIESGLSNQEIADYLILSYHTVTWYVKQIFSKLGVSRRTEAVAVARSIGILDSTTSVTPKLEIADNLPDQATSFVGREEEITRIVGLLDDTSVQLITVSGPGGIGKTRLLIEVGKRKRAAFADGVFFVSLQPLSSHHQILPTIAQVLGLKGKDDRVQNLAMLQDFLQEKSVLLLLDNFEHILGGVRTLADLLSVAPRVAVLASSRESLNLQEEHLICLEGLPYPVSDEVRVGECYEAVELFAERAGMIQHNFSIEESFPFVARICRLVEGIPLAIELAASWARVLSCDEIAQEIQQGLDSLVTTMKNVPIRHRSMRAAFDVSWNLLGNLEKSAFEQLSVFRGGFSRDAALQVAGADLKAVRTLVEKSFIRRSGSPGRYDIHELLRQYGEYHLRLTHGSQLERARSRHCDYYMNLLTSHRESVFSNDELSMMRELEPELDNIRLAWHWAVDHSMTRAMIESVHALAYFHVFRGRFVEEAEMFEEAVTNLERDPPNGDRSFLRGILLSYLGWVYIRLGEIENAESSFIRSQSMFQQVGIPPPHGLGTDPRTGIAMVACIRGDYEHAINVALKSCQACDARDDHRNRSLGEYVHASALYQQGRYEDAMALAEGWLREGQTSEKRWSMVDPLNMIGILSEATGDPGRAKECYWKSYEIRRLFDDPQGMATSMYHLGTTSAIEGDHTLAGRYFQESFTLYTEVGDRGGAANALVGLGQTALATGDLVEASSLYRQALEIVTSIGYVPALFSVLIGIGEIQIKAGQPMLGIEMLTLVQHHSQSGHEEKVRASRILAGVAKEMESEALRKAIERGRSLSLDRTISRTLEER